MMSSEIRNENSDTSLSPTLAVEVVDQKTSGSELGAEAQTHESHLIQLTEYEDVRNSMVTKAPMDMANDMWMATDPLPDQALREVLSRSYQLAVIDWTALPPRTSLVNYQNAINTLLNVPQLADKVKYFQFFRCKGIRFTVRVNATQWHYGTIALSSTVNNSAQYHNEQQGDSAQAFNNRCVLIDATTNDAVDYDVFWKSNRQWYDIRQDDPFGIIQFQIKILASLRLIGEANATAKITLFANFIEPQVTMPTYNQISPMVQREKPIMRVVAQMAHREARKKSSDNSVVSDARSFMDTTMEVVETIAGVAEKVAPLMMFMADKPTSLQPEAPRSILPNMHGANFHGLQLITKMCGDPEATAGVSNGILGENDVNPSIYQVIRTPSWLDLFTWNSGTPSSSKLYERAISVSGLNNFAVQADYTPTYLSLYSSMFRFWRGGVKFHFHFTNSTYITSRIRICWFPPDYDVPTNLADDDTGDIISQVIEVTGCVDHTMTIPWVSPSLYKFCRPRTSTVFGADDRSLDWFLGSPSTLLESSLGSVAIYLTTPIVSVETGVVPVVTANVWVAAAEDFKYSNFSGECGTADGSFFGKAAVPLENIVAQCSIQDTFKDPFEPIIRARSSFEAAVAASEMYTDMATLGKRDSWDELAGRGTTNSSVFYDVNSFRWDLCLNTPGLRTQNFQQLLTLPFVNFRGSIRFKIFTSQPTTFSTWRAVVGQGFNGTTQPSFLGRATSSPVYTSRQLVNPYMAVEIPWNTYVPFFNRQRTLFDPTIIDGGLGLAVQVPTTDAGINTTIGEYAMSFGDDFAMGVMQSLPMLTSNLAPAPLVSEKPVIHRTPK